MRKLLLALALLGAARSLAAHKLGIDTHVYFLGFQNDLRPLWAVSAMALFASEAEGLCTALIEAQGAGLPAAISRAGGMVEVQGTAEGAPFSRKELEAMLALAERGIRELVAAQKAALGV